MPKSKKGRSGDVELIAVSNALYRTWRTGHENPVFSFLASMAVFTVQTGQDPALSADIYGVYSASLSNQPQSSDPNQVYYIQNTTVPIAIFSRATPNEMCYPRTTIDEKDWNEALDTIKQGSFVSQQLEREFQIKTPYVLLDNQGISDLTKNGILGLLELVRDLHSGKPSDRTATPANAPNSNYRLYRFTPTFFNQQRTLALVQVSMMCGPLCGYGGWKVFEKIDGRWLPYRASVASKCSSDWIN